MSTNLTFDRVSEINRARAARWHHGFPDNRDGWTGADWSNAMQGEAGEAGNVVKKLRRDETGIQQASGVSRDELLTKLATEIGDTFLYLDLLAQHYGLDLAQCVVDTFNRVSEREGFPERIDLGPVCAICGGTSGEIVDRNCGFSARPDYMHAYGACPTGRLR